MKVLGMSARPLAHASLEAASECKSLITRRLVGMISSFGYYLSLILIKILLIFHFANLS